MKPDPVAMAIAVDVLFVLIISISFIFVFVIMSLRGEIEELQKRITKLEHIAGVDYGNDNHSGKKKNDNIGFSHNRSKRITRDYMNGEIDLGEYSNAIRQDSNGMFFTYAKTTRKTK